MNCLLEFKDVIILAKKAFRIKDDKDIAKILGMSPAAFHNRKRTQSLPYSELLGVANKRNVNFNWLLTGKGSMDLTDDETDGEEENEDKRIQAMIGLYKQLPERQQNEIFSVAEEKQRLNQFEFELNQLKKRA